MIYYYADVMPDGRVRACFSYDGPDEGPPEPHWKSQAEGEVILLDAPVSWAGPSDTAVLYWKGDAFAWVETAQLVDVVARAVGQIDEAADQARLDVVSRLTNTEEYKRAEQQAREYRAAGYPLGDVPTCVGSWVKAKWRDGWTAQQAADDIIATADRWYGLLDGIRDLRLCAKEDVRHVTDSGEAAARVQQFTTDLTNLMKGVS